MVPKDMTARLMNEIDRWQTASGLVRGGDPGGVTPEMLERHMGQLRRVVAAAEIVIDHMTVRHGVPEWKEAQRDRANPNPARWSPSGVQMDTAPLMALRKALEALPAEIDA